MTSPETPESDPGFIALYTGDGVRSVTRCFFETDEEEAIRKAQEALPKGYTGIQLAPRHNLSRPVWTNDGTSVTN